MTHDQLLTPKTIRTIKTLSCLLQRLPVSKAEVVICVSVKSDMLRKCFLSLSQELQFDDLPAPSHDTQQWRMFSFRIGHSQQPDKHENKDRIGSFTLDSDF